jgi:molybdopterin-dependent oxidoreductase alpha subunit
MSADDSTHAPTDAVVGGGLKKVLYTLRSAQRIGVARAAKALTSHNACKVCGLGMGGQLGGMTNELGEFPSVCNKSVQAQITDIQPPIPDAIFDHPLSELQELDGHELEHLGRLNTPLYKSATSDRYEAIDWARALELASRRLRETRAERSFFYASGRSSNEAGFILQLFARALGTNNVNNCSYYCHQATSVALEHSIGTGTATVELADLGSCDLIFVIGANPASNHPRFIHQLKACRERGGHVVIINPAREPGLVRFAVPKSAKSLLLGGTEIASVYLQPRIGSDIALFKGIAKALIESEAEDEQFITQHTENFEAFASDIRATSWQTITSNCGLDREDIEQVADLYRRSKSAVFAWGMGLTTPGAQQHSGYRHHRCETRSRRGHFRRDGIGVSHPAAENTGDGHDGLPGGSRARRRGHRAADGRKPFSGDPGQHLGTAQPREDQQQDFSHHHAESWACDGRRTRRVTDPARHCPG